MSVVRRWFASVVTIVLAAGALALPSTASSPTADRPYGLKVPAGYDGHHPVPLVVLLHGYGSNGQQQAGYFGLLDEADKAGFLLAYPDGTRDRIGRRFWNATDACCDFGHTGVDDVAYLNAVVDDMEANFNIDKKRVFFTGHSNGGFMSHRMACDSAGRVAAIMALAGDVWQDASKCNPSEPVAVLLIHGDADTLVPIQQAEVIVKQFQASGVPCELVVRKGAGHGGPAFANDAKPLADWFDKYLLEKK